MAKSRPSRRFSWKRHPELTRELLQWVDERLAEGYSRLEACVAFAARYAGLFTARAAETQYARAKGVARPPAVLPADDTDVVTVITEVYVGGGKKVAEVRIVDGEVFVEKRD